MVLGNVVVGLAFDGVTVLTPSLLLINLGLFVIVLITLASSIASTLLVGLRVKADRVQRQGCSKSIADKS